MKRCSPRGSAAAIKSDRRVLCILMFLLVSAALSWAEVAVDRIHMVLGELDTGIVKIKLLLLLVLSEVRVLKFYL